MSARSRRSRRAAASGAPAIQRSSAGSIASLSTGGRPVRQSSQGKNSYQPAPLGAGGRGGALLHQGQVGDRDQTRPAARLARVALAVAEGVELLDVAEPEAGLLAHPAAQGAVEGAVGGRLQRAEGEGVERGRRSRRAHGQDARHLGGDRHDHGVQADGDLLRRLHGSIVRPKTSPKWRAQRAATAATSSRRPVSRSTEVMPTPERPQGTMPAK